MRFLFVVIVALLSCSHLHAAHFRENGWVAEEGILESIRIVPRLPAPGSAFRVRLTGSWPESDADGDCYAPLDHDSVRVIEGRLLQIVSTPRHDPSLCGQPPARWDFEVDIPASAWQAVDDDGFLRIEHLLWGGNPNETTGVNQRFDMRLGTHEVPAFLGSGFWVSEALPWEGLMIEQQGNRVLFYGLRYDRDTAAGDDGEPVWRMVSGRMEGDSTLGRSARLDWPIDPDGAPVGRPSYEELLTRNDSGSIIVDDWNHIRAFTGLDNGIYGAHEAYRRMSFGNDPGRLPVFVPPLAGQWSLHGFEGRDPVFGSELELLAGEEAGPGRFRFRSVSGNWTAECSVGPAVTGDCSLTSSGGGAAFDFFLSGFNGNLARGVLRTESGDTLEAVLVRAPWRLPVPDHEPR